MQIAVRTLADHDWSVRIHEGSDTPETDHRLSVDPETIATLGVTDEARFVREAVAVWLDHAKATELPHDVTVDWLEQNVDGFLDELTARLS